MSNMSAQVSKALHTQSLHGLPIKKRTDDDLIPKKYQHSQFPLLINNTMHAQPRLETIVHVYSTEPSVLKTSFSCFHNRFAQSSSVTTHMRIHSGERPYKCHVCSRGFADSSTLTKHLRIHTGEKPYQCKMCEMRFSQSGNLSRHMRVHRRKNI